MTASEELLHRMVDDFPELKPLLTEHLVDQEGELLPYLFMADVARWVDRHSMTSRDRVSDLLAWLEREYVSGNFDERNLIDVGVVEMLPASPEGDDVLSLLGPELRARAVVSGLLEA